MLEKISKHKHAIVMGASMGGLLTARVLSDHFEKVTIIERDPVQDHPESRKGQPHTRHLHGLLATGLRVMSEYFPDLPQGLKDNGAVFHDFTGGMRWSFDGGYRKNFEIGFPAVTMTRALLEYEVRKRVLAISNISLKDNTAVKQLITSENKQKVTGVITEARDGGANEILSADLIVDVTGRGTRTPQWLKELGFEPAPESEVKVDVGYSSRVYKRNPKDPRSKHWFIYTPNAPKETRFGAIFPVDGDRWIVSVGGWHGDHAPTDEKGFNQYIREIPHPDIHNIISHAEPISEIFPHKLPSSIRRHYEKLKRFPLGYLVLGDAVCSFNPIYGQGMTSAALQTSILNALLKDNTPLEKLAAPYFKRISNIIDTPWQLAVGEDFRFPRTTGPKPFGQDLLNQYVGMVHQATLQDEEVCAAFIRVMNLMKPATSLLTPKIIFKVLRNQPQKDKKATGQPATRYQ